MIRRLVLILLLLAAPAYAAETVLYDVETVTYQVIGAIPPYVSAGVFRSSGTARIELVDAGPQPAGQVRWTSDSLGQLIIFEAFTAECPACVDAHDVETETNGARGSVGFLWLGGARDPFASFYLTQATASPHTATSTESFTIGRRVSPRGPKK